MRFTYSPTADALAVELAPGRSARMVRLGPGINADLDAGGRLLTIEVLNASGSYPRAELEAIARPVEMIRLAEAIAESGLDGSTLRRQILAGKIKGAQKVGQDWLVPRHELWNYLEARTGVGRPPGTAKGRAVRAEIRILPTKPAKAPQGHARRSRTPLKRAAKVGTPRGDRRKP